MSLHQPLDRALLLIQRSRYKEAEQELRRILAEHPHDAWAHALLGVCLSKQERFDEAQAEVELAIVLAPDWYYAHYCRSRVMSDRRRDAEAEASAREAVRLDPANAGNYARLAATLFSQSKCQAALTAAEEGLVYDAEHPSCGNLRTMALMKLGREGEAISSVDQSLARDPDDGFAHANKGWALLHEGKPRPALDHFREALRLDPMLEYARQGTVEALKARNPVYRLMLGYFLWMDRLSERARWGVIFGGWIVARILRKTARENPELEYWINPLLITYLVFVLLTWFAVPLFNLLLRVNQYGRHALSRDQRIASNWFAGCLGVLAAAIAASFAVDNPGFGVLGLAAVGVALPLVTIYQVDYGWPRHAMSLLAGAMIIVGLLGAAGSALGQESWAVPCLFVFLIGFLATPWLANYLATVTVRR